MENSIIQELNAEADRILGNTLLPAKSMTVGGLSPRLSRTPRRGLRPGPPRIPAPLLPPPPRPPPACQQAALAFKNNIRHTYFVERRGTPFSKIEYDTRVSATYELVFVQLTRVRKSRSSHISIVIYYFM